MSIVSREVFANTTKFVLKIDIYICIVKLLLTILKNRHMKGNAKLAPFTTRKNIVNTKIDKLQIVKDHKNFKELSRSAQDWVRNKYYEICQDPNYYSAPLSAVHKAGVKNVSNSKLPTHLGAICHCHSVFLSYQWAAKKRNPTSLLAVRQTIGHWKESFFTLAFLSDNYKLEVPSADVPVVARYKQVISQNLGVIRRITTMFRHSKRRFSLREVYWIAQLHSMYNEVIIDEKINPDYYLRDFAFVYASEELAYEIIYRGVTDKPNFQTEDIDNEFLRFADFTADTQFGVDDNTLVIEHIIAAELGYVAPRNPKVIELGHYYKQVEDRLLMMRDTRTWDKTSDDRVLDIYKEDESYLSIMEIPNNELLLLAYQYIQEKFITINKEEGTGIQVTVGRPDKIEKTSKRLLEVWNKYKGTYRNLMVLETLGIKPKKTKTIGKSFDIGSNKKERLTAEIDKLINS